MSPKWREKGESLWHRVYVILVQTNGVFYSKVVLAGIIPTREMEALACLKRQKCHRTCVYIVTPLEVNL